MTIPRFVVARSAGGWVILHDNKKKRLATIFPRDNSLPEDKAEAAAVRMAEISAAALNRMHQAMLNKKQQEGGN